MAFGKFPGCPLVNHTYHHTHASWKLVDRRELLFMLDSKVHAVFNVALIFVL